MPEEGREKRAKRAGADNLRHDFTPEERAANGRKGGLRTAEVRRRQKTFRESIRALLACQVPDEALRAKLEGLGVDATVLNAIHAAVNEKAMRGDVTAARYLREALEEERGRKSEQDKKERGPEGPDMSALSDQELRELAWGEASERPGAGAQ